MNIFEIATRKKFRFPFKGPISVEDLWTLSDENLDSVYKALNSELKETSEESLLKKKTEKSTDLETKIEIVKYILLTKQQEAASRLQAREDKEHDQMILEIIASKEKEDLKNMTKEQLLALLSKK